jgi:hypothetical protein
MNPYDYNILGKKHPYIPVILGYLGGVLTHSHISFFSMILTRKKNGSCRMLPRKMWILLGKTCMDLA